MFSAYNWVNISKFPVIDDILSLNNIDEIKKKYVESEFPLDRVVNRVSLLIFSETFQDYGKAKMILQGCAEVEKTRKKLGLGSCKKAEEMCHMIDLHVPEHYKKIKAIKIRQVSMAITYQELLEIYNQFYNRDSITGSPLRRFVDIETDDHVFKDKASYILFNKISSKKDLLIDFGRNKRVKFCFNPKESQLHAVTITKTSVRSEQEIEVLKRTKAAGKTEYVVEMHGFAHFTDKNGIEKTAIFLEYMDAGDLIAVLYKLNPEEAWDACCSLIEGLKVISDLNIWHRDLKPDNIFCKRDPITKKMIFKIADFDLSCFSNAPASRRNLRCGTVAYLCPDYYESYFFDVQGEQDVWAMGINLLCVIARNGPPWFEKNNQLKEQLQKKIIDAQTYCTQMNEEIIEQQQNRDWLNTLNDCPLGPIVTRMLEPNSLIRPTSKIIWESFQAIKENSKEQFMAYYAKRHKC